VEGKIITFSGDTEWVESLIPAAENADLFIAECYGFERQARHHMDWRTIEKNLPRLTARQIMITHMGDEMLANTGAIKDRRVMAAWDGMTLNI
jgi:ribonuclease BN (tRNA processing enzyme)